MMSLWNRSNEPFTIQPYERVAQYMLMPVIQATFEEVESFEATERGEGGFGSSGTK